MKLTTKEMLIRLGNGEKIASLSAAAGITRAEFDAWWQGECRRRVPPVDGQRNGTGPRSGVKIHRNEWGIPQIQAANDTDLFFGFGYATAQDRLFQLDYLRRKATGRLAEILGQEAVDSDVLYRTINLAGIAEAEWPHLPAETQMLLSAYCAGINAYMEEARDLLPIEFALLDYQPETWKPLDSLAIIGEFRWYLTGRFPVIVIPELARRILGDGSLYKNFLLGEADEESILPRGSYPSGRVAPELVGATISTQDEGQGSNNWVLSPARTTTGKPLLASDPHIPFAAVSIWQEVHLQGGSFQVAGVALVGMPAIMIGRNPRVAWGITNNICSQRDLYQEKTDPAHPGCFLYDGRWEPARQRQETIQVRNAASVQKTIRSSRNGPIVDEILPPPARATGPVALRWLGSQPCGWLPALLGMDRARTAAEFREAIRPWLVPTFNLVFADVDGHIGQQSSGRIPIRRLPQRGYRPGWDPDHQWDGLIPFEGMPHLTDPENHFVVTANNRLAPDDYPYPLAGTWPSGHRARRIRDMIEAKKTLTAQDCRKMQLDVRSGRAAFCVPPLVALLAKETDPRISQALALLREWDFRVETNSVPATLFNVFFIHWCRTVAAERFPAEIVDFMAANAGGLAASLLVEDNDGWFHRQNRNQAVKAAFQATLNELGKRFGQNMTDWTWGKLHTLVQKHFLTRGDLGQLLDRSGVPTPGDSTTVNNGSFDAAYGANLGAGYRMVVDLADPDNGLWGVEIASTSGHPGSPHYDDQLKPWSEGEYHYIPLTKK